MKSYSSRVLSHLLLSWAEVLWEFFCWFLLLLFRLDFKTIGLIYNIFVYITLVFSLCGSPWDLAVDFSRRLLVLFEFLYTWHVLRVLSLSVGKEHSRVSQMRSLFATNSWMAPNIAYLSEQNYYRLWIPELKCPGVAVEDFGSRGRRGLPTSPPPSPLRV